MTSVSCSQAVCNIPRRLLLGFRHAIPSGIRGSAASQQRRSTQTRLRHKANRFHFPLAERWRETVIKVLVLVRGYTRTPSLPHAVRVCKDIQRSVTLAWSDSLEPPPRLITQETLNLSLFLSSPPEVCVSSGCCIVSPSCSQGDMEIRKERLGCHLLCDLRCLQKGSEEKL